MRRAVWPLPIVQLHRERNSNALAAFPGLTANGFGGGRFEKPDPHEVETAIMFLSMCGPAQQTTYGSYSLKHMCEDWGGIFANCPYVTNGALIVAAHALGFVIRPYGRGNPNAGIGVGNKRLLRQIMKPFGWWI